MKVYRLTSSDDSTPNNQGGAMSKNTNKGKIMTIHDFKDGNGPVPAHQHSNGGGWVADTATVEDTVYVGPDARVYGDAWVHGNALVYGNAEVGGTAEVYGNAEVGGTVRVLSGFAFVIKKDDWQITEVPNGNGTTTLYANAEFEPVEIETT